jgi:predicted Holliday junction resolvase-like endonuclease
MSATVLAAVIAAAVALMVALFTSYIETRRQTRLLKHELAMQEQRLRAELRTEYMAEDAIHQMLDTDDEMRSFERIQARVGGFTDQQLRRLLVRSGALRYAGQNDQELWGLRSRNKV